MLLSKTSIYKHFFLIALLFLFTGCAVLNPRAKSDYTVDLADMDFVFVKGGTFQMGSNDRPDEQPVHRVTVNDMFVGMYEVTFAQYDAFCEATGREKPFDEEWGRGSRPVLNISWHDATAYAAWLSEKTGLKFRLPSESEWEYFARAGTTTQFWMGETLPKGSANCSDCGSEWDLKMTAPVGSFKPNPWRIYDTAGNVAERVLDDANNSYAGAPTDGTAFISNTAEKKRQRGGAWDYRVRHLSSSARDARYADAKKSDTGFRLILSPDPEIPFTVKE